MLAKSFIKKWLGIPTRGVTDVAIFHPYMLNVKQPSALYLEGHAGNHASMKLKGDSVVKAAIDSQVTRENEWTKKSSTAVTCDQMFATCVEKNQIFVPTSENTWNYESSMRHEIPKSKSCHQTKCQPGYPHSLERQSEQADDAGGVHTVAY